MQSQLVNPDDKVITQTIVVPNLNEWEAMFAETDNSLKPEFADWDVTLMDGLE